MLDVHGVTGSSPVPRTTEENPGTITVSGFLFCSYPVVGRDHFVEKRAFLRCAADRRAGQAADPPRARAGLAGGGLCVHGVDLCALEHRAVAGAGGVPQDHCHHPARPGGVRQRRAPARAALADARHRYVVPVERPLSGDPLLDVFPFRQQHDGGGVSGADRHGGAVCGAGDGAHGQGTLWPLEQARHCGGSGRRAAGGVYARRLSGGQHTVRQPVRRARRGHDGGLFAHRHQGARRRVQLGLHLFGLRHLSGHPEHHDPLFAVFVYRLRLDQLPHGLFDGGVQQPAGAQHLQLVAEVPESHAGCDLQAVSAGILHRMGLLPAQRAARAQPAGGRRCGDPRHFPLHPSQGRRDCRRRELTFPGGLVTMKGTHPEEKADEDAAAVSGK